MGSAIVDKVKRDLERMVPAFKEASVIDSAVIRFPGAVNWYFPGSYSRMPDTRSSCFGNVFFAGDVVRTRHGSWSQEKPFVTGVEAANKVLRRSDDFGILPLGDDEAHVALGRFVVDSIKRVLKSGKKENDGLSPISFFF